MAPYQAASGTNQVWQFYIGGGSSGYAALAAGGRPTAGAWSFVTGVFDGVNAQLYENGTLAATTAATMAYAPVTNTAKPFAVGCNSDLARFFSGTVDELFYLDRGLSATEVSQLFAAFTNNAVFPTDITYSNLFRTDLLAAMRGRNSSLLARFPFVVDNPSELDALILRARYEDGLAVSLNGQEVLRANAPADLVWNSAATSVRVKSLAMTPKEFDLSSERGWLVPGTNVLAIQGLNSTANDPDFLLNCELLGLRDATSGELMAYLKDPTPGSPNGPGTLTLGPIISTVGSSPALPIQPTTATSITVTARVSAALSPIAGVTLNWRVMFNALNAVPMRDDGLSGDGAAGDGVYGAIIPAGVAAKNQMIRWYVTTSDTADRLTRWPVFNVATDSEEYLGTVVTGTSIQTALPVVHTFIQNTAAADTFAGTHCSLFYGGEFYDNILITLRGQSSSGFTKKPYNLDFNRDHRFRYRTGEPRVKDAKLMSNWGDKARMRNTLAHEYLAKAGSASHWIFQIRLQRNGAFFSIADLMEDADDLWLERLDRSPDGALYKVYDNLSSTGSGEKKTRLYEDKSDLNTLITNLAETVSLQVRATYAYDNLDLPQITSYFAGLSIISSQDHGHKNFYVYRDTLGTGEWSLFPGTQT